MNNALMNSYYPESQFGGFSEIDGTVRFYDRVNALLNSQFTVLDAGCGEGAYDNDPVEFRKQLRILKGKCRCVLGIDVDPQAANNPHIDEFRQIEGDRWPVDDESIDLCLTDYVLEHIESPGSFFAECARVLKKGGYLCVRTPNARSYESVAASIIPNKWHAAVVNRVKNSGNGAEVFDTYFRCNTVGRIRRIMKRNGLRSCVFTHVGEPQYLAFSRTTFGLGTLLHRIMPRALRSNIFAFGQKLEE